MPTRPAWRTCSACGWRCCTRATTAGGWPRAPSSGSPAVTGSRPGGCGRILVGSSRATRSSCPATTSRSSAAPIGIWRRMPARSLGSRRSRKDPRDRAPRRRLALELDAVLAWLVRRILPGVSTASRDPEPVTEATGAYRGESDALARFIDLRCLTGPHYTAGSSELFAAWRPLVRGRRGRARRHRPRFARAVQDRGLDKFKDGFGRMRWKGIAVQTADDETTPDGDES